MVLASSAALILALALPAWAKGVILPKCGKLKFPASGQTTAYTADKNNGAGADTVPDDGTVEAGATLSYVDNLDGTVTDLNTGLSGRRRTASAGGRASATCMTRTTPITGRATAPPRRRSGTGWTL